MSVDDYYHYGMAVAWLPALVFPLVYGLTAQWWKSVIGHALFTMSVGVLLLVTFSNLLWFFGPEYSGRDSLRVGGVTLIAAGVWFQAAAIVREKIRQYRSSDETVREHDSV